MHVLLNVYVIYAVCVLSMQYQLLPSLSLICFPLGVCTVKWAFTQASVGVELEGDCVQWKVLSNGLQNTVAQ